MDQPITVGLPDQRLTDHLRHRLNIPLAGCGLRAFPSNSRSKALVVVASASQSTRSPRKVDVLARNVGCRSRVFVARVVVRSAAVVDVNRVGWVRIVAHVPIGSHEPASTGNHLEPILRHHKALATRVRDHCRTVHPSLKQNVNLCLTSLIPRKDELLRGYVVLLNDQVAPEVKPFRDVTSVRDGATIRADTGLVGLTGSVGSGLVNDRAKEEPICTLLHICVLNIGLGAKKSSLDIEEGGERGCTVVYGQIEVVPTSRTCVDTRLVGCGSKCGYSLGYVVFCVGNGLKDFAGSYPIIRRVGNAVGGNSGIRCRPVRRLRQIVGIRQEIANKSSLTPSSQIRPVAGTPDLPHVRVKQIIDRLRCLRRKTRRRHANQSANVRQSATVGDRSHLVFGFHPSTCQTVTSSINLGTIANGAQMRIILQILRHPFMHVIAMLTLQAEEEPAVDARSHLAQAFHLRGSFLTHLCSKTSLVLMDLGFLVGQTVLDLPPPLAHKLLGDLCDDLIAAH